MEINRKNVKPSDLDVTTMFVGSLWGCGEREWTALQIVKWCLANNDEWVAFDGGDLAVGRVVHGSLNFKLKTPIIDRGMSKLIRGGEIKKYENGKCQIQDLFLTTLSKYIKK